jgi:hypothetical protein
MQINNLNQINNYSSITSHNRNSHNDTRAISNNQQNTQVQTSLEELSSHYNFRSMTASERLEFANKAVSTGDLTLKEAAGILPLPELKRVETEGGYAIEQYERPQSQRFDVLEELKNSIEFSKQHGGSKGIEIRESLLAKLQHLDSGARLSTKA